MEGDFSCIAETYVADHAATVSSVCLGEQNQRVASGQHLKVNA